MKFQYLFSLEITETIQELKLSVCELDKETKDECLETSPKTC